MLFEPRDYNLSIPVVKPIPVHSLNRAAASQYRVGRLQDPGRLSPSATAFVNDRCATERVNRPHRRRVHPSRPRPFNYCCWLEPLDIAPCDIAPAEADDPPLIWSPDDMCPLAMWSPDDICPLVIAPPDAEWWDVDWSDIEPLLEELCRPPRRRARRRAQKRKQL